MNLCQYCAKTYTPRRRGGRFCSTKCRVAAWEKAQKSEEDRLLYQGEEQYFAKKIDFLGEEAGKLLPLLNGYPTSEQLKQIATLLERMKYEQGNSVVQRVLKAGFAKPGGTKRL